ncbi:MAG: hypothetical protein ACRCXZ_05825 [Patescibacteria group bacterium]
MTVISKIEKILTIEKEEDISLGDLLCYKDIAIGIVVELDEEKIELNLLTDIFGIKLGNNPDFYFQKKNDYFFLEYIDNILTTNGSISQINWESEFDFVPMLDENCQVNTGDVIGYVRYKNLKYPLLVPEGIVDGTLIFSSPNKVNYEKPVNQVSYHGRLYPIFIYQKNNFTMNNNHEVENTKLILHGEEVDQEILKVFARCEVIVHLSSKLPQSYIQSSITKIKEYFAELNMTNNISVFGYSDYPFFREEYSKIVLEKLIENSKQFLLRGLSVIVFVENYNENYLSNLYELEGEYKSKSGKQSMFKIISINQQNID